MKNFIQEGTRMTWTNDTGSPVASGDPVIINGRVFVACVDIANGSTGAIAGGFGVYEFAKETSKSFAQVDNVFWDATAAKVTSDKDAAAAAAVAIEGNTGNGTVGSLTAGANAISETWTLKCIAAGTAAGAAVANNTGNGTITAAPTVGAGAKVGVYRLTCVETGANVGGFIVEDPDGINLGIATVAAEYIGGGLTFTIADGSTDFAAGDAFTVTVAAVAANSGTFSVVGSVTGRLADATVAVAYTNGYLGFTIADGTTDFVAGDGFTIAVTGGNTKIGYSHEAAGSSATTARVAINR